LGSSAEFGLDTVLEFASIYESTRCCGPKEKVDPIDPLERELDGEGKPGIENTPNGLEGGGVEVIVSKRTSSTWIKIVHIDKFNNSFLGL
jgi:hypothetical protein